MEQINDTLGLGREIWEGVWGRRRGCISVEKAGKRGRANPFGRRAEEMTAGHGEGEICNWFGHDFIFEIRWESEFRLPVQADDSGGFGEVSSFSLSGISNG